LTAGRHLGAFFVARFQNFFIALLKLNSHIIRSNLSGKVRKSRLILFELNGTSYFGQLKRFFVPFAF